jgi:hypothetical protein
MVLTGKLQFKEGPNHLKEVVGMLTYNKNQVERFLRERPVDPKKSELILNRLNTVADRDGKFKSDFIHEVFLEEALVRDFKEALKSGKL